MDQSGSFSGVKRHDYLPYGEELWAGVGSRTFQQGYVGDNIRQKFTQQERDVETGLDYFNARYYASNTGRFTSPDPYYPIIDAEKENVFKGYLRKPQNWNRYAYCINNPLNHIDPTGLDWYVPKGQYGAQPEWFNAPPDEKKYEKVISYVYKSVTSGKYFALNPYANESAEFDNAEAANNTYQAYIINNALGDAPRLPDAVSVSGSVLTVEFSLTLEAHGNLYGGMSALPDRWLWAPRAIDAEAKTVKGFMKFGANLSAVYLDQVNTPTEFQADKFLTGPSASAGVGIGFAALGGGKTYSPGTGTATNLGFYTPGPSVSGGVANKITKTPFRWR